MKRIHVGNTMALLLPILLITFLCSVINGQKPPALGVPIPGASPIPLTNPEDTWFYHMDTENKEKLVHFERFTELSPRSALLCPRNYFLESLVYNFHDRLSEEEQRLRTSFLHISAPKYAFKNTTLTLKKLLDALERDFRKDPTVFNHSKSAHGNNRKNNMVDTDRGLKRPGILADISSKHLPGIQIPVEPLQQQNLNQNQNQKEQLFPNDFRQPAEFSLNWPGAKFKNWGPCPTLVYCLGHQSCSFHLGNKFCQNDPVPGWRKTLDVTYTCARDTSFPFTSGNKMDNNEDKMDLEKIKMADKIYKMADKINQMADKINKMHDEGNKMADKGNKMVESLDKETTMRRQMILQEHVRKWKDQSVQLVYNEEVDHSAAGEYFPPLQHHKSETDVFDLQCMPVRESSRKGYVGECLNDPPPAVQVTKDMWRILARSSEKQCRQELLEVYCAYKYSPTGQCLPPFTQTQKKEKEASSAAPTWSLRVLPHKGQRLDLANYHNIYSDHHHALIPARLAFIIMSHDSPQAVSELLKSVYTRQNFYVIHIDKRKPEVHRQVVAMVQRLYGSAGNVRVLGLSRSFASSWGSWYINRAQLECIEELLRMGVWDFTINLTGSDLALRHVDDLAYMLAPYRGKTVMSLNGKLNYTDDVPIQSAWHSCGGHIYNVTYGFNPHVQRYSHSQFGIWSRDYLEYLLSGGTGRAVTDRFQFAFLTSFIADEQYLGSILLNSPYKETMVKQSVVYMKPFVGETSERLCRHSEETDLCGQGPSTYQYEDLGHLHSQLHHYFFARKFSTDPNDPARKEVLDWTKHHAYARETHHNLHPDFVRKLGLRAVNKLHEEGGGDYRHNPAFTVDYIRVVPKLLPSDPCCEVVPQLGVQLAEEFMYIMDISVNGNGNRQQIRASVDISHDYSHTCYGQGHLRLVHLTTRRDMMVPPEQRVEPSRQNFPSATNPGGGDVLWLMVMIHIPSDYNTSTQCKDHGDSLSSKRFATWDISDLSNPSVPPPSLSFDISVVSPTGQVLHKTTEIYDTGPIGRPDPNSMGRKPPEFNMWTTALPINREEVGFHTVIIKETGVEDAYTYCQSILIVEETNPATFLQDDVLNLFEVLDVALVTNLQDEQYYKPAQRQTEYTPFVRSAELKKPRFKHMKVHLCKLASEAAANYREPYDPVSAIQLIVFCLLIAFLLNLYRCGGPIPALKCSLSRRVLLIIGVVLLMQVAFFIYSNSMLMTLNKTEL